jgi:hypothetical protein
MLTGSNVVGYGFNRSTPQNRMAESLRLWQQLVNLRIFARASMILFFNKVDLLPEKLTTTKVADYFPTFSGLLVDGCCT